MKKTLHMHIRHFHILLLLLCGEALRPPDATNEVGQPHTFTVTLLKDAAIVVRTLVPVLRGQTPRTAKACPRVVMTDLRQSAVGVANCTHLVVLLCTAAAPCAAGRRRSRR